VRGVLTKRDILAHPWTVIRHFGLALFIDVVRAPEGSTFLEIVARHEFIKEQRGELRLARQVDLIASRLQRNVLAMTIFSPPAAAHLNQVATLLVRVEASQRHLGRGQVDPLLRRFETMLGALAAKDGPVKAALGTLSQNELIAVESRVLRNTQKRCRDEVEEKLNHARAELEMVRAHLVRLFLALDTPRREAVSAQLSAAALALVA
jgi:hypothetical protein